jgi:hypothetical protein
MSGMTSGQDLGNPALVAAFRAALLHQGLIALLILALAAAVWGALRARPSAGHGWPRGGLTASRVEAAASEPAGRRLLRIGFGILWLFDGLLQTQPKMPGGLAAGVIEPAAHTSPSWVRHLTDWGAAVWTHHPVPAATTTVWLEVGLGIWLLAARRGALSRLGGLASAGWGLLVWVLGESFGQIFAPGLSWLTGAPGAAAVYTVAGVLIALPACAWHSPRLGRLTLSGLGLFLVGMAILQAWPGRGFWQGISRARVGNLAAMAQTMAQTPQPAFLSGWLSAFGSFDEAHGFAVNLFAVTVLAVTGTVFLTGRPRLIGPVLSAFAIVCVYVWVLVQDLGFLGGLGTDPNSMIPFALLSVSAYLALSRGQAGRPVSSSAYVDKLDTVSLC